jgi:hypothetical protein
MEEATALRGSENSEDDDGSESVPVAPATSKRPYSTNIADAIAPTTVDNLPLRKRRKVDHGARAEVNNTAVVRTLYHSHR